MASPWVLDQLLDQLLAGMNGCHLRPTGARGCRGCWGDPSVEKAPPRLPPFPAWSSQRDFWLPWFPAVRGMSSNWSAGFALLTMQSNTPGVWLSLEKCPSVLELWRRWTRGSFHECSGFINIFMDNVTVGCGLLWGCTSTHGEGAECPWMRGMSLLP